jgi:hypothetical protein
LNQKTFPAAKLAGHTGLRSEYGVPETMENPRQWNGYVCPDCRFVFRVPKDHDGNGVVCASCRRLLRIPSALDTTLPLMTTVQSFAADEGVENPDLATLTKRRRDRKMGGFEDHQWDEDAIAVGPDKNEKRTMRLMLVGGSVLLAVMVAGVVFSTKTSPKPTALVLEKAPVVVSPVTKLEEKGSSMLNKRGEVAFTEDAEPLARKFLDATSVEELLPLVSKPEVAEARMRDFYAGKKIEALGLSKFDSSAALSIHEKAVLFLLFTRELEERSMVFRNSPQGLKIDWECWVGWSEISWEKFQSEKPTTGHVFRVTLSAVEYYNFAFADESKWRSYRLLSPDGEHAIYGYVEKNTVLEQKVSPKVAGKNLLLMLKLKFPVGASSATQVEIESVVADGWVLDDEKP